MAFPAQLAVAELQVHKVEIGAPAEHSSVPPAAAQGRFLAPQAVSAVDVSFDGQTITVGTMAFRHDANVWQFRPDGSLIGKRQLPPWAPLQVATLTGGRALAVGLAYSRVTSPEPSIWAGPAKQLLGDALHEEYFQADVPDSQFSRLRTGAGDWREGWLASQFGELFVTGPDWAFVPPARLLDVKGNRLSLGDGDQKAFPLPTSRASRMAAGADGKRVAFGWLSLAEPLPGFPAPRELLSVWSIGPNRALWSVPPTFRSEAPLPDPAADFPELARDFRLRADHVVSGSVAAAVAVNQDGSRIAVIEYAVWVWTRSGPAIGNWDPPIHALNFVPRQRGRLRVFDGTGQELCNELLPTAGIYEVGFGGDPQSVWCWPGAWFARGMAGSPWLPTDEPANILYHIAIDKGHADALTFPDAVAQCAVDPVEERVLVSCWDGLVYLVNNTDTVAKPISANGPARLAWSKDGSFAVAGTAEGRLLRIERNGTASWNQAIAIAEPPIPTVLPVEVIPGIPIFQGGRISKSEHAYGGDIWMIIPGAGQNPQRGREAVFVDAGGTSGFATTRSRLAALGVEQVTHVLQSHSHGDHSGGAYLWRAAGAKIVGPKSAAIPLTWLMPMLTDYGIFPPRPLDLPLPMTEVGDEAEFTAAGLQFRALFVPGHTFDSTIYQVELAGKRIAFTGDLGFEAPSDILHRCWGDAPKARAVLNAVRSQLLPWKPDVIFTGHGVRPNGTEFLTDLIRRTEGSLAAKP